MSVSIFPDAPVYVSYSQFTSYLQCGKAYQLRRLFDVPEVPAWYLAGGSAVHAVTEAYDKALWEAGR